MEEHDSGSKLELSENADATSESVLEYLLEMIERLESHLIDYQDKVKEALMSD